MPRTQNDLSAQTDPQTDAENVPVQGTPDEGGDTVNHVGAGHADAMEPYGDALANSDQVAVNAPTNGPSTVVAPTGAELPADTKGTDPEGPVADSNTDTGALGYSRDALLRIASDNDVTVPANATSEEIVALLDAKHDAPKMTTILAPNESYTGTSASVDFINGKGQTDKPELIEWFRERGYKIEGDGGKDGE